MAIDFYCFVLDYKETNYPKDKQPKGTYIFENFNFDIKIAKKLGKFTAYCKETNKFYNENWEEISLTNKKVLPRCIIPDVETLYNALEQENADLCVTRQDLNMVKSWPEYINPRYRDVESTHYSDFLQNFNNYKNKFGRVFFKTKRKYFACEVKLVFALTKAFELNSDLAKNKNSDNSKLIIFDEPIYFVTTNESKNFNDIRFNSLDKNEEVFVSKFVNLTHDHEYTFVPTEYRSFVVDGKFVTSRSWIPNRQVPNEVKNIVQSVIDNMPREMQKTFVVDCFEFIDENGNKKYDLGEINPIVCAGYDFGSSIFLTEDNYKEMLYDKYDDMEEQELIR